MIILGISDSHEAHACILVNGKIISAVAEERFSRIKSDQGYPKNAIEHVLNFSKISPNKIDLVVFAGKKGGLFHTLLKPCALFSIDDWIYQNEKYWKKKLIEKKNLTPLDDFNLFKNKINNIKKNPYYSFVSEIRKNPKANPYDLLNEIRKDTLHKHLGIKKDKISFIRHEECHQNYQH